MGQTLMLCAAKWATQVLWYSARMRVFYPSQSNTGSEVMAENYVIWFEKLRMTDVNR